MGFLQSNLFKLTRLVCESQTVIGHTYGGFVFADI